MDNFMEAAAVFVALALDTVGEPPTRVHPVVGFGNAVGWLARHAPEGNRAQFAYGVGIAACVLPLAILPAWAAEWLAARARTRSGAWAGVAVRGSALKPFFALRMLADAGEAVRSPLESGDLPAARDALQSLVSRNRSSLSAELVAAAAIESLAENLSDSVVAPLFWYALGGLPGAAAYRFINTCDAMIGYHGKYEYLGKATARLDDALNLVPARLTAALIVALAPLYGGDMRGAWRIWQRDARRTASPNAGHPMGAAAGALGVRLEKVGQYTLGGDLPLPLPQHLAAAERMVRRVGIVAIGMLAGARVGCAGRITIW